MPPVSDLQRKVSYDPNIKYLLLSDPDVVRDRRPPWSRYRSLTRACALLVVCLCFSLLVHVSRVYLYSQTNQPLGFRDQQDETFCVNCSTRSSSESVNTESSQGDVLMHQVEERKPDEEIFFEHESIIDAIPQDLSTSTETEINTGHEHFALDHLRLTESSLEREEPEEEHSDPALTRQFEDNQHDVKTFYMVNPRPGAKDRVKFSKCEYSACAKTSTVEEADVVMFNAARMRDVGALPRRRPGQIWVMYSREPTDLPSMDALNRTDLNNQVNFSRMIYSDSTWPVRYGVLEEREPPDKNYEEIFQRKRHAVAWFVSHCERPSRRMEYVRRMMSTIDVHIYGRCGNWTCGRKGYNMGGKKDDCLDMLSTEYKFYLSFENTFCRDYVSEKFFNMFEDVDVIPVVRGGANYKELFPAGTFIDASDFDSPEHLGRYLHKLSRNERKYIDILQRKNRYHIGPKPANFFCDVCRIAHTGQMHHVYENFYNWVRAPGNCWSPTDL